MRHEALRSAAVIGGGTMGADIAAILVAGGWTAHVVEPSPAGRASLAARVAKSCAQLDAPFVAARLHAHPAAPDAPWAGIGLAIECAPEDLALKRRVFAELERLARPDATLASNSSSFPISAIGRGLATGARMCGLHFFMPAHIVPLVEVVRGEATDPAVCERLVADMKALGKVPVLVRRDIPGFLANRIQHALAREAFWLVDEGIASAEDVDKAVRYGFGFRFIGAGPILQKDLAGLDIHCAASATTFPTLNNSAEPARCLRERVAAGKLGVKTGEGFYKWPPERIAAEKARYERALLDALAILKRDVGP
ncbi:MAG: 3-hydroxyacyl-CoA dehydrogenase [Burkholderiales bacterium]|nr:3-hydroxyacyl-CoA dehydrogenase [Burkholderiales bacterium]